MPIIPFTYPGIVPTDRFFCEFKDNNKFDYSMTIGACSGIGNGRFTFGNHHINNNILIGRFSSLGQNLNFISGVNHIYKDCVTTYPFNIKSIFENFVSYGKTYLHDQIPSSHVFNNKYQIIIGHDVWIGNNSTIFGGVKIGSGAIIGANSVVAKDIPPYAIAVGNPAQVIKYRFDKKTVKKFLYVKWWNWDIDKVFANAHKMYDVEKFLSEHYSSEIQKNQNVNGGGQEVSLIGKYILEERKIYNFAADFRSPMPLWKRVVTGFLSSSLENAVLILWSGLQVTQDDVNALKNIVNETGFNDGKIIHFLPPIDGQIFLPQVLRKSTHFITSRELITIDGLDCLYDTDIKILSALDEGIFEGEPIVDWYKLYGINFTIN